MPLALSEILIACCALYAVYRVYCCFRPRFRYRLVYPPGPRGLPLLGNLFQIPSTNAFPWLTYRAWSSQYDSDIVRFHALGTNVVILNSLEAITELLEKRSSVTSDRPRMVMYNDLCGFSWTMGGEPYGEAWRNRRRMAHQEFRPSSVTQYRPHLRHCAMRYLRDFLREPDDFAKHIRLLSGSTILSVTYGIDAKTHENPYFVMAEKASRISIELMTAGTRLVEIIPSLKYIPDWFPGANFKRQAKMIRSMVDKAVNGPVDLAHRRMRTGYLGSCAAKSLIESFGKKIENLGTESPDFVIRSTLGSLYLAGAETNIAALETFFLAMLLYPDVQRKAREELDRVLGSHRLPDFSDQNALPYITAIVQETLRWHPVAPLALPHMLSEDDVYKGYFMPKGCLIIGNAWSILHDEATYPEPSRFKPERFLHPDGTLNTAVRDPSVAAFGFGRRICPGRYIAVETLWITMACTLAMFEICPASGEDGQPLVPKEEYTSGVMSFPKSFNCVVKPRSLEHVNIITQSEWDNEEL